MIFYKIIGYGVGNYGERFEFDKKVIVFTRTGFNYTVYHGIQEVLVRDKCRGSSHMFEEIGSFYRLLHMKMSVCNSSYGERMP
jgi:hypothetical protein